MIALISPEESLSVGATRGRPVPARTSACRSAAVKRTTYFFLICTLNMLLDTVEKALEHRWKSI